MRPLNSYIYSILDYIILTRDKIKILNAFKTILRAYINIKSFTPYILQNASPYL